MPRRIVVLCLLGALVAATASTAGGTPPWPAVPGLGARESASRIVDRTFACAPMAFGGVGDLDMSVSPPREFIGVQIPAQLTVGTGSNGPQSDLVEVRARARAEVAGWQAEPAGVYANSRRCTPARASLPLSSRGIGGAPTQWEKELDCRVRGRVVVRVRSVLQSPADWRRVDRFYAGVRQPVVETRLAVRTQRGGKPIAYMEHDANGRVKLWYSPACG
jgi:hypothetical protein